MVNRTIYLFLCTLLIVSALAGGAAQAGKAGKKAEAAKPVPIDAAHMVVLTQTAVIALNQANLTDDYSVLHALAGPKFRKKNTAKDLEKIFDPMRKSGQDLSPIVLHNPQFTRSPMLLNGMLRLTGFFPTQPMQVHFDLLFEPVDGQWRLYGISVASKKQ